MTHRLGALLLCFLFATQAFAVIPSIMGTASTSQHVAHDGMGGDHCEDRAVKHCPHCQDLATTSSGACTAQCAVMVMPSVSLGWLATLATVEFPGTSVPLLLTRSDSPPTPPPIA